VERSGYTAWRVIGAPCVLTFSSLAVGVAQHSFTAMKSLVALLALALLPSSATAAALPGVIELKSAPEQISDAQIAKLLGPRVASANVVALGETVHGSSAFLRLQTRLVRYLIANQGFRLVVWENPTLRSLELTRWLSSCTKTKTRAPVDVLYMPTISDLPLFEWMCDFNHAHPGEPIVFRGMDVWDRPWEHYSRIRKLGARTGVDSAHLKSIESACPAHEASSWGDIHAIVAPAQSDGTVFPAAELDECRASLTKLIEIGRRIGAEKKKKNDSAFDDAFELALSASTVLGWLEFYHYNWADDVRSWNGRDRAQGRNINLVMEKHAAARAIVSAHTSHVSHNKSRADWWGFGDIKSGIHFLAATTGKKVFNVAFTAYEASGTQGEWSLPSARNSLDKRLHDAGHVFSFFFSDAPFLSENAKWWIQNQNYPGPYESGVELILRDHFDAFFFFDKSHLDKALPARPMWEP
jgi:erythromycin esterase-like protein